MYMTCNMGVGLNVLTVVVFEYVGSMVLCKIYFKKEQLMLMNDKDASA